MKKVIMYFLISIITFTLNITYVAGAETNGMTGESSSASGNASLLAVLDINSEYTIAELQKIAQANSRQALSDDMDIKKKEMAVRTVRSDSQAMSDSILNITKPLDVALELDAANKTKQDHLNQLNVDVYKAAMNILLCEKEIMLEEQKLALSEERLVMAQTRYKASTITQDDLDSAQYNVEDRKVSMANVKEKLGSLYLDLKKLLNQPLDTRPVKIKGEIKQDKFEDMDTDKQIGLLYKSDTSVSKASGKLDIARTAMDIAKKLYKKGDLTYDSSVLDLQEAEYDLNAAKTALAVKLKNSYNVMINKLNDLELAGKYTDLVTKKLNNSKTKYNKGTISKDNYMKAKEALLDAEFAELSSIVDFNTARADFLNAASII